MMFFLATILYIFISLYNRILGLCVLFVLLPSYVLRFSIAGYPSTWVEVMSLVTLLLFAVDWMRDANLRAQCKQFCRTYKWLLLGMSVLAIAATISLFFTLHVNKAFDQWRAYYIEPMLLLPVFAARLRRREECEYAIDALALSVLGVSALAAYQEFSGWYIINPFWQAADTRRVTSIFGYPNGIGLYLSATVPLLGGTLLYYIQKGSGLLRKPRIAAYALTLLLALLSIWWARSTGALIAVAGVAFLAALFYRRLRIAAIIVALAGVLALITTPASNPHRQELLFQDLSGQIRLSMWAETFDFLRDHPFRGAGLVSYQDRMPPYHRMHVEIYQHPHNLLLNFWTETGLLGLIGFVMLFISLIYYLWKQRAYVAMLALASVCIHGLVDVPLMRYDLAIIFWFTVAFGLAESRRVWYTLTNHF